MTSPARQLLIDGTDAPAVTGGGYLPSVLLDRSLPRAWRTVALHFARQTGDVIVDLTCRESGWWDGVDDRVVVRLDLDPALRCVDARADWRAVPLRSECCALALWDPPWNLDGGKDGDARRRYTAPYKHVEDLLMDMKPAEWARVVRPGGHLIARTQNFTHAGRFVDLRGLVAREMLACGLWELRGEVLIEVGGRAPNHAMRDAAPSIATRHSYFSVFRRAKTKDRALLAFRLLSWLRSGRVRTWTPKTRDGWEAESAPRACPPRSAVSRRGSPPAYGGPSGGRRSAPALGGPHDDHPRPPLRARPRAARRISR